MNMVLSPNELRKKVLLLYGLIYLIMLIIIGLHINCFVNEWCIHIEIILTWLPQIINSCVYYKKRSLSYFYIIILTFSRLFFPCFLHCQTTTCSFQIRESSFLITSLSTMGLLVVVLLAQSLFGSRWFLPESFRKKDSIVYLDDDEKRRKRNECYDIQCAICLCFLIRSSKLQNKIDCKQ